MDLVEGHVGLHVDVANQNLHVATDKNQPKTSTSQPQMDSGCYSIGPSTICDTAQNGGSLCEEESENDGKEEQQDNIAVKDSEAVVTEQPLPPQPGTTNDVQEAAGPTRQVAHPEKMLKDDVSESIDLEPKNTPGHSTDNVQDEPKAIGKETLGLHNQKDLDQMQKHSESPRQKEKLKSSVEPMEEELGDSASGCGPPDSCKNKNKQPPVDQRQGDMPTEDQDRKKQEGDKMIMSHKKEKKTEAEDGQKEDRVLPNKLLSNVQASKEKKSPGEMTNSLEKKAKPEEPAKNVVVPSPGKKDQGKDKSKSEGASSNEGQPKKVPTNTQVKSGQSGDQTKGTRSKNPVKGNPPEDKDKTGIPSNNHVKRGQSEEPKSVDLPKEPLKQDPLEVKDKRPQSERPKSGDLPKKLKEDSSKVKDKTGVPEKNGVQTILPNNPRKKSHQDKDKADHEVLSNTPVKRPRSKEPKSGDLLREPPKEDPPEVKDKTGVAEKKVVRTVLPNNPRKEGRQDKAKVPSNTQVKRGQSEEPGKNGVLPLVHSNTQVKRPQSNEPKSVDLPTEPLKEDPPEVKDKTGVPEKNYGVLPNNPRKKGHQGKDKAEVLSNTQVKRGKSDEPVKNGVLPCNPAKEGHQDKDKTPVPSNTHVKRPQPEETKSRDLPKKLKEDPSKVKDKTGVPEKNGVLPGNPTKKGHQDKDKAEVPSNIHVKRPQSNEPKSGDKKALKEDPPKVKDKAGVAEDNGLNTILPNNPRKKSHKDKDNTTPVPSNIQTPENTSSHEEGDKTLQQEDTETLKKVKNWMNLKIPSLLALLSFLFDLLKAWSHKEEPPDVTSNHKTNRATVTVPVDQDALVYNVQRLDEEVLGDSSDEDDEEEQDGYHQPEWLVQADDDVEDEDLYLGSEDTIAFPEPGAAEPGAAAGPMFCSEVPENGQIAVGGGVSICPFNNPSQIGDHVHPSHHFPTASAQGLQNATDMSLEEAVQRYRRTERGMTVTVLGLGEQVVSQTRVYDPTTLQEHILEHTAEQAFAKYPMDGFTVKMPGGRTVPLEMPLDPWSSTFQNIIFQLHPANHGDSTWLWRVTHSENTGGGTYSVEVNMHNVGRGLTRVPDNPDDRGSGLDCCICQDTQAGGTLVETSCGHKFHEVCLFKWLQKKMDQMEKTHLAEEKLRKHHRRLKGTIRAHHITGSLKEKGVLTDDDVDRINNEATDEKRTERLLFILAKILSKKRSSSAFEAFIQSLKEVQEQGTCLYEDIVRLLEGADPDQGTDEDKWTHVQSQILIKEYIAKRLDPDKACAYLVKSHILTEEVADIIQEEEEPFERAMSLLSILPTIQGKEPVEHFLETNDATKVEQALGNSNNPSNIVVSGIAKSGKTQITRRIAKQFRDHHPTAVVWALDGQNRQTLLASMRKLLEALKAEVTDEEDITKVDECLDQALQNRGTPVLLIVDDLEDGTLLTPTLLRERIQSRVLIPTRQEELQLPAEADVLHISYLKISHTSLENFVAQLKEGNTVMDIQEEMKRWMLPHYEKFDPAEESKQLRSAMSRLSSTYSEPTSRKSSDGFHSYGYVLPASSAKEKSNPSSHTQSNPEVDVDTLHPQAPNDQPVSRGDSTIPKLGNRKDRHEEEKHETTLAECEDNDKTSDGTALEINITPSTGPTSAQCQEVPPCRQMSQEEPTSASNIPIPVLQRAVVPPDIHGIQTTHVATRSTEHADTVQQRVGGSRENPSNETSAESEHGKVSEDAAALPVEEPRRGSYGASTEDQGFGSSHCTMTANAPSAQSSLATASQVKQCSRKHAPTSEMDSTSSEEVPPTTPPSERDAPDPNIMAQQQDMAAENIDNSTQLKGPLPTACIEGGIEAEGAVGGRCSPNPSQATAQDQTTPSCHSSGRTSIPCREVQNVSGALSIAKGKEALLAFCAALRDQSLDDIAALITGSQVSDILRPITNVPDPVNNFFPTHDANIVRRAVRDQHIIHVCEVAGSGKTQIARWIAKQFRDHHPTAVVWALDGQNSQTLLASMRKLLEALNAQVTDEEDITKVDECLDQALQNRETPVLLIVDDLEDGTLLTPTLLRERIQSRVLILTRQEELQLPDETPWPCNLEGGFQMGEGIRFFQIVLEEPAYKVDHLEAVVGAFDGRPLGLAAAREFMHNTHTSPEHYLFLLKEEQTAWILQEEAQRLVMAQHYNKFNERNLHPVFQAAHNKVRGRRDTSKTDEDTKETCLESPKEAVSALQLQEGAVESHSPDDQDTSVRSTEEDLELEGAVSGIIFSPPSRTTSEEEEQKMRDETQSEAAASALWFQEEAVDSHSSDDQLEGAVGGIFSPPQSCTASGLPRAPASIPPPGPTMQDSLYLDQEFPMLPAAGQLDQEQAMGSVLVYSPASEQLIATEEGEPQHFLWEVASRPGLTREVFEHVLDSSFTFWYFVPRRPPDPDNPPFVPCDARIGMGTIVQAVAASEGTRWAWRVTSTPAGAELEFLMDLESSQHGACGNQRMAAHVGPAGLNPEHRPRRNPHMQQSSFPPLDTVCPEAERERLQMQVGQGSILVRVQRGNGAQLAQEIVNLYLQIPSAAACRLDSPDLEPATYEFWLAIGRFTLYMFVHYNCFPAAHLARFVVEAMFNGAPQLSRVDWLRAFQDTLPDNMLTLLFECCSSETAFERNRASLTEALVAWGVSSFPRSPAHLSRMLPRIGRSVCLDVPYVALCGLINGFREGWQACVMPGDVDRLIQQHSPPSAGDIIAALDIETGKVDSDTGRRMEGYVHRWLQNASPTMLQQLLMVVTGCDQLTNQNITIVLDPDYPNCVISTCTQTLPVPVVETYEGFCTYMTGVLLGDSAFNHV
ncbi:hypothetical protein Bbelb_322550 [Branchiostoma belcheri]|nr:hypothetical protein Bbelb_322550 [Branchiostoma belcheri]